MKSISGLVFFTRRGRRGAPRVAADACVLVRDLRPAVNFVVVRTSRPMWAGALPRQMVHPGQFLSFSGRDFVCGADEVPAGLEEKKAAPGVVPGRRSLSR